MSVLRNRWLFVLQGLSGLGFVLLMGVSLPGQASAPAGTIAPNFSMTDLKAKPFSLKDYAGRWVALEWTNPECPFVKKHYNSGNMQATQKQAMDAKLVWIQINSTNPNHSDYKSPESMLAWNTEMKTLATHAALDADGKVGKAYGAKTTPQMVLIDPKGVVVYHGAIDSIRSASASDLPKATNYMKQAMTEALAGKTVSMPESSPYGCSVKY
jgi:cytochrome oxidase Cu insertion factor (SCO1/SenC/PrrC family)